MSFQISAEQDVLKKMGEFRERIPKAKPGQKTKFQDELVMLNELLQVRQVLIKSRTFRVFMNQKLPPIFLHLVLELVPLQNCL